MNKENNAGVIKRHIKGDNMSIKTKTQETEFDLITVTCPACKAHRTVLNNGWSAIICSECRGEINHPEDESDD